MKLRRLRIDRLPGIADTFTLEELGDGVHVIYGPNGIGKSSLCRATEALLWSDRGPTERISVVGTFEADGEEWRAERDGSALHWQHDGIPGPGPALPASHLHQCFILRLRDLLDPADDGGRDVAEEIQRQMSGGFDLRRAAQELFGSIHPRHGRRELNEFDECGRGVREASGRQAKLARREDRLDALEAELDQADAAGRRVAHLDRALDLAQRRAPLASIDRELTALPAALAQLTGRESDEARELEQQTRRLAERRAELERSLAEADALRKRTGLAEPLDSAALTAGRTRADALGRLEEQLGLKRTELQQAEGEVAEAARALGEGLDENAALDLEGTAELFRFLDEAHGLRTRAETVEARLSLLAQVEFPDERRKRLESLRQAVDALRTWLRAPDLEASPAGARTGGTAWWLAAALLTVAGLALGGLVHPAFVALTGAGAGIALLVLVNRARSTVSDDRAGAERAFSVLGIDKPAHWRLDDVTARLRDLESELAELSAAEVRKRDRDVERQALLNEQTRLASEAGAVDARRQALAEQLGFSELRPDAELVDAARALDRLRQARASASRARAAVAQLEQNRSGLLAELAALLEENGEATPGDAAAASAGLAQLAERDGRLRQAIADEQNARHGLAEVEQDDARVLEGDLALYQRAGLEPGDSAELEQLVSLLPRAQELREQQTTLRGQNDADLEALDRAGESALAELDADALTREREAAEQLAETAQKLRDEIAAIRAEVGAATRGHALEDEIAQRDAAREALDERRSEALWAAAGSYLIERVEQEHERTQMPRVLQRARDLFAEFTHQGYRLELDQGDEPRLRAFDLREGVGQALEELSDGTRSQLLLAARLAFLEESERGTPLPLFLDEALDQSDPGRFHAIAGSLGRIARDHGRQIFYLTSDPHDVERIRAALRDEGCKDAQAIDLQQLRRQQSSAGGPAELSVEPHPSVPALEGHSAEVYGALIQATPLDPRRGHAAQHLFHLLWDDLPLLHRLLERRIERAGQWHMVSGSPVAAALLADSERAEQLEPRAELLESFCELWLLGRGRPVDRDAIVESGAISDRFLEAVVEIANELQGDAGRLIECLRERGDERLGGFRSNSTERIESFLTEQGYRDEQAPLDEGELAARAMASPAAVRLPADIAAECLHRWWRLAAALASR